MRLPSLAGVNLATCRRVYRDKYVKNFYWLVDSFDVKTAYPLTREEYVVISAACHYNTTVASYLMKEKKNDS